MECEIALILHNKLHIIRFQIHSKEKNTFLLWKCHFIVKRTWHTLDMNIIYYVKISKDIINLPGGFKLKWFLIFIKFGLWLDKHFFSSPFFEVVIKSMHEVTLASDWRARPLFHADGIVPSGIRNVSGDVVTTTATFQRFSWDGIFKGS